MVMEGNSTQVDPNQVSGGVPTDGASTSSEGADPVAVLTQKLNKLEDQYSNSSREAHRLNEELKQEREARLRLEGSLTSRENAQKTQFPSEEAYLKYRVGEIGEDEKKARADYREKLINHENTVLLHQKQQAIENLLRFRNEELEKTLQISNPDAQKASEFFKGFPELEVLPVHEKIQRYKEMSSRMGVTTQGRDTSQIKMAASGSGAGHSGRSIDTGTTAAGDDEAKKMGLSSHKEMIELSQCKNADDHAAWKKRWKR